MVISEQNINYTRALCAEVVSAAIVFTD